jgi:phosphoglycolate phosphatase
VLLIFDWDGTLIDSSGKIISCMQRAAQTSGLPVLADDQVRSIIGLGLPEVIETLYPQADAQQQVNFREHYVRHFIEADQVPCQLFPRVMDVLEDLKQEGHQLAVATGKARRGLDRVLGNMGLADFFHGSRCADETRSKPHPQMLHELLQEFSRQPDEAMVIGDTVFDMEMAQRADIPRIGVSYGAHRTEALQTFQPRAVIDCLSELKKLV